MTLPTPPITPSTSRSFNAPSGIQALTDQSHQLLDPLLGIGSQVERAVKHQPHQEEKDRKAPELVGHESVDDFRHLCLFLLSRGVGFPQSSGDESVFLIGKGRFDVFIQQVLDPLRFPFARFLPFGVFRVMLQLILYITIFLK